MTGVKAIASGYQHNLAISSDGLQPLAIQPPPLDDFALSGKNFTFSLSGVGTTNVTYQWNSTAPTLTEPPMRRCL